MLRAERTEGRVFRAGYDGELAWMIPPPSSRPVWISENAAAARAWLAGRGSHLPFLQLERILVDVRDRFDLSDLLELPPGAPGDPDYSGVRATARRKQKESLPETIDMVLRRDTGTVHHLVATWKLPTGRYTATYRLLDEEVRRDDWYGYEAHTQPGRRVRQWYGR